MAKLWILPSSLAKCLIRLISPKDESSRIGAWPAKMWIHSVLHMLRKYVEEVKKVQEKCKTNLT